MPRNEHYPSRVLANREVATAEWLEQPIPSNAPRLVHGDGPAPARLMIVGEAPGEQEEVAGKPFVGYSGMFLNDLLASAGIHRRDVFVTNVSRVRPPGNKIEALFDSMPSATKSRKPIWRPGPFIVDGLETLRYEVERVDPDIIVPMGTVALWAIEGSQSISKWRGSILTSKPEFGLRKVIPTYHPAYVLRDFEANPCIRADLARAVSQLSIDGVVPPQRRIIVRPSLRQVWSAIWECYRSRVFAADIETRRGEISCLGLAWTTRDAISIPFMDSKTHDGAYWTEDEEFLVWQWISWLMSQPDMELVGQNWSYDASYFVGRRGFLPRAAWDTMDMHHVLYAGMPKTLDFMASMYCEWYRFWKDDGKEWDVHLPEEQHWQYNAEDCLYTLEIKQELERRLHKTGLMPLYRERQDRLWPALMRTTTRGIRASAERIAQVTHELGDFVTKTNEQITFILGHPLNPKSPLQVSNLLYDDFGCQTVIDRKTGRVTVADDALDKVQAKQPLLRPLIYRIKDYRSATTLLSGLGVGKDGTVGRELVDDDGRIRFNLNIGGTETYRLSSSKNNFGRGLNGQNITKGDEDERHDPGRLVAPNLRTMFVPDPGCTLADIDLKRADLVVVAREARDDVLLGQLQQGFNPYLFAAAEYLKCSPAEVEERHGTRYTLMKSFFHGTNYCGSARTMASNCGMTTHESETLQKWWFGRHPGIKRWHERLQAQLFASHEVRNAFGYRRLYFDRPGNCLSKAAAWQPQSTVALVTLEQLCRLYDRPWEKSLSIQHLLQVHDSNLVQYRTDHEDEALRILYDLMLVEIPYPGKPLIIYPTLATSTVSWGHVRKRPWPHETNEEYHAPQAAI